jgi:exopolysaccharide biosynthesis predicted pyruvyltransferase EpsI
MGDAFGQKVIYKDPATHYNLGDQLLVMASVKLLKNFRREIKFCRGPQTVGWLGPRVNVCNITEISKYLEVDKPGDRYRNFIYYHPGGNWGDFYYKVIIEFTFYQLSYY